MGLFGSEKGKEATPRLFIINYEGLGWFGSVTEADGNREASTSRYKDE